MAHECCHDEDKPLDLKVEILKIIFSFVLAFISLVLAMPEHFGFPPSSITFWGSFLSSALVVLLWGRSFLWAIPKVFSGANMNTLIGISIVATFGLSFWNGSQGNGRDIYFDSAAFIAAFVLLGQWLEGLIRQKMNQKMANLVGLLPLQARQIKDASEIYFPLNQIQTGMILRVLVGERVPVDGKIMSARGSSFDESMMTGESKPVFRDTGSQVFQGALNVGQPIDLEVIHSSKDSLYEQLIDQVHTSLKERPAIQKKVDQVAAIFVPLVVGISLATAIVWKKFMPESTLFITTSISVLAIACPCALGMATPLALLVGVLRAAKKGVLIKSLESVEKVADINVLAFDKTGTLTEGKPSVDRMKTIENFSHKELLKLAASIEQESEHPYAFAIQQKAKKEGLTLFKIQKSEIVPGKGVMALVEIEKEWKKVCLGNLIWLYENGIKQTEVPEDLLWEAEGTHDTTLWVALDSKIVGILFLIDAPRQEAPEVIQKLVAQGLEVGMITGDHENVAKGLAKQFKLKFYHAGVLPHEKATLVKRLSEPQKKGLDYITKKVAFVGDGVNDAPALAQAHLGIAMGSGAAIAQTTSDLVLLSNNLHQLLQALDILKATRFLIRQNLVLAFFYNIISIPMAAGILYLWWPELVLSPKSAAVAMILSDLTVLLNSLRATRFLR